MGVYCRCGWFKCGNRWEIPFYLREWLKSPRWLIPKVAQPQCSQTRAGEGPGAKSHKTERDGSVSGAPCETVVEDDRGKWWGGVNEVVGLRVDKCEVGEGAGAQKPRNRV
jgi:hypothetical protein